MHAKLGDFIHYLRETRPHIAPVLTVVTVENAHDDWASTEEQAHLFQPFGPSGKVYCTVHGMVEAKDVLEVVPAGDPTLLSATLAAHLTGHRVQALVATATIQRAGLTALAEKNGDAPVTLLMPEKTKEQP